MALSSSLLWELSQPDLPSDPSFLFGTMHVKDQRAYQFLPVVQSYLQRCSAFALEYDLNEAALLQAGRPQAYLLPAHRAWRNSIPEKKYRKIRQLFLKAVQLDIDGWQHLQPLILSNLILEKMLSDDYPLALDHHLWALASQLDKQLLGIETFRFQMDLLSSIPLEDQLGNLLELARHISKHRRQIDKMADLYARADLRQLHKQVARSTGRQRRLLLYNRNQTMARKIHEFGLEQATFSAIGAGHLSGKFGVLRLLKLQGWKLRPVKVLPNPL